MLDSLYREHNNWLKSWIGQRLGCPEQASDLAQETFVRILTQQRQVQPHTPRAYLSTIARGLMIDLFRRKSLEQAYLDSLQQLPETTAISPEDHHLIIEALMHIDQMLDQLGERSRQVFLMAQLDGLSHAEISRRLGVSVNTVRKHYIRALTHCLLLMDDSHETDR